ncbi:MAG: family 1 glycosylhydrolase [Dehalococcoidia bacterium]
MHRKWRDARTGARCGTDADGIRVLAQALEAAATVHKLPIVTENGIGTVDDMRRIAYTEAALRRLHAALAGGIDVRGYIHCSAMD